MAEEKLLKSLADGVLKINESSIDVAVLENGVRIITHSGVFRALGREPRGNARLDQIPAFMDAKNLQPLISLELKTQIKGDFKILGFEKTNDRKKFKIILGG
ncbi:hypothetical protein ACFD98_000330 [Campylobacter coli]